jgi:hypothetical protein
MRQPSWRVAFPCALVLALAGALVVWTSCGRSAGPAGPETTPEEPFPAETDGASSVDVDCGGTPQPITLGGPLPKTPTFQSTITLDSLQCDFDVFSWNSFLALSHSPSGGFGDEGGDNPTLWETWPNEGDIFLPGGAPPPDWPAGGPPPHAPLPPVCQGEGEEGERVFVQVGKQPIVFEASLEPFESGPLIDVHGYYARFGITVNRPMYQYIVDHDLYSRAGQNRFSAAGRRVELPCGCDSDPSGKTCPVAGQQGAIMVKTAWKVLDTAAGDDPSRFHKTDALVLTPATGDEPATCERTLLGLVGLHLVTKTQADPQWLWATFEQVDNVPTRGHEGEPPPGGGAYSFFQPDCGDCNAVNEPPPQPWDPHLQPVTSNAGKSQVVRQIPIDAATHDMNAKAQSLLGGTVWQHYELVSTQWPTDASGNAQPDPSAANNWCNPLNPVDETGKPAPAFLGNTTLETYIQGTVPQASSSCTHCHLNATLAEGGAEGQESFSDFTYLLERAQ